MNQKRIKIQSNANTKKKVNKPCTCSKRRVLPVNPRPMAQKVRNNTKSLLVAAKAIVGNSVLVEELNRWMDWGGRGLEEAR